MATWTFERDYSDGLDVWIRQNWQLITLCDRYFSRFSVWSSVYGTGVLINQSPYVLISTYTVSEARLSIRYKAKGYEYNGIDSIFILDFVEGKTGIFAYFSEGTANLSDVHRRFFNHILGVCRGEIFRGNAFEFNARRASDGSNYGGIFQDIRFVEDGIAKIDP